ncbi:MAG: hypothetical protein HQ481_07425 [Alphaproteobacteria bacterium]|nr:hypothetical protein [Alphaproteobacteria bacterium]
MIVNRVGKRLKAVASRGVILGFAAGALISCASAATVGYADDSAALDRSGPLPILVIGEDSHLSHIPRDDPAFRRVVSELQAVLDRRGFRVVDEESVAAALGWNWTEGRDKIDVLEVAKLMTASEQAGTRVRAAAVFRIEGTYRDLAYTTRVDLHLSGELYDVASNRFLGAFDLPTETVTTVGRCHNHACASDAIAERARDLASELGAVLARQLASLASPEPPSRHTAASTEPVLEAVYTVTLRHLSTEDAMAIQAVMTEEFPGYRSHALIRRGTALRRYEYVTTAGAAELERWLTLLLVDMGLDPEGAVALSVRDGDIRVERVLSARAERPAVD